MTIPDDRELREDEVRAVLQRATEIDGTTRNLKVGDFKAVALEAGISEQAVSAALIDVLSDRTVVARAERAPRRLRDVNLGSAWSWARSAALLGFGAMVAGTQNGVSDLMRDVMPFTLGILVLTSLGLAVRRMDGDERSFWKRATLPWISYLVIGMFAPRPDDLVNEFAVPTVAVAAVALTAGLAVFRYLERWRSGEPGGNAAPRANGIDAKVGLAS